MDNITPVSTGILKKTAQLHQKKYRQQNDQFVAEGHNAFQEIFRSEYQIKYVLLTKEYLLRHQKLIREIKSNGGNVKFYLLSEAQLLKVTDTVNPQGVVVVGKQKDFRRELLINTPSRMIYLEEIRDPGNLAAAIRNTAWFGFGGILLSPDCVDFYSPKVIRGSVGAVFHMPFWNEFNCQKEAQFLEKHTWIAMDSHGDVPLNKLSKKEKLVLCFGSESRGISDGLTQKADKIVRIPSPRAEIESLNLSVATAISMYEIIRNETT